MLAGLSAGSMCWFEWGVSKGVGHPVAVPGLGFLPGSNSVHCDGEPERRPFFLDQVRSGEMPGGYMADDGVGLVFRGTRLAEVVASRPHTHAYRVARVGDEVIEDALEPRLLPGRRRGALSEPSASVAEFRRTVAAQRNLGQRGH